MRLDLGGKVALITGGSRGIGLATALAFAKSGASGVVITSRRSENLAEAISALTAAGAPRFAVRAIAARADDDAAAEHACAETIERFGSLDILVNNAGTNPAAGSLLDVDMNAVDKTWAVNQRAPLIWARSAVRRWMGAHGGTIINVASTGGIRPAPNIGAYNISKAALIHLTHQLAFELAPRVRVNAIAPGVVKTRLSEMLWTSDEDRAVAGHPLGRLGEPEEVAAAITYLCSTQAGWITGAVLPVDGGQVGASAGLG